MEALFQIASGVGLDGNTNGSSLDNGVAGLATNQTTVSPNGDIPAFGTFLPDDTGDPNGPVRAPSGNEGGIGLQKKRQKATRSACNGRGNEGQPRRNRPLTWASMVSPFRPPICFPEAVSRTSPQRPQRLRPRSTLWSTKNVEVIGLGAAGLFTNVARTPLEAISTLTGAVNNGGMTIDVGNPAGLDCSWRTTLLRNRSHLTDGHR